MSYLERFLSKQNELNVLINGEGWENSDIDWYTPLVSECCELIQEVKGFHWRDTKQEKELKTIIGELADVLHFLVAGCCHQKISMKSIQRNLLFDSGNLIKDRNIVTHIHSIHKVGFFPGLHHFRNVVLLLDLDLEKVIKHTLGKCILNCFRQYHGYKEGRYRKIWRAGKDSEVLYDIIEGFDETDFDPHTDAENQDRILYDMLNQEYSFSTLN